MSLIIGLTGPTGSGKSSASVAARKMGFKVIDCDKVARVAVEKGTKGLAALVNAFGEDILNPDETLNRKALAQKAFASSEKTNLLNKTLLPFISELVIKQATGEFVLMDAPTLFESGMDSICDFTVAVLADEEIRLSRITERDNIDEAAARLRISAGKTEEFYKENADYIIYNNKDENSFISEFCDIINEIKGKINK